MDIPAGAITLLTGFLMYRFKMIDDREKDNFQRFRNFVKRWRLGKGYKPVISNEYDATEMETWLDKDVPYNMYTHYKCHPNANDALDYYRDYNDCKTDKNAISLLIALNLIYLLFKDFPTYPIWVHTCLPFIAVISLYFICFKKHTVNIFNNSIINVLFNKKAKSAREQTVEMIEKDFQRHV